MANVSPWGIPVDQSDQAYFQNCGNQAAPIIRELLPDAMRVVKIAAGALAIMAAGLATMEARNR